MLTRWQPAVHPAHLVLTHHGADAFILYFPTVPASLARCRRRNFCNSKTSRPAASTWLVAANTRQRAARRRGHSTRYGHLQTNLWSPTLSASRSVSASSNSSNSNNNFSSRVTHMRQARCAIIIACADLPCYRRCLSRCPGLCKCISDSVPGQGELQPAYKCDQNVDAPPHPALRRYLGDKGAHFGQAKP